MSRSFTSLIALLAVVPAALAYAAFVGLGVARQGAPAAVALSATALVFGPAFSTFLGSGENRLGRAAAVQLLWASLLLACLPIYFPGERREAVATGLALITMSGQEDDVARAIADRLPDDPALAAAQAPLAEPVTVPVLPPAEPLDDHEIALPYEGEGRRLSIPVVFEQDGISVETYMMLDTGATYTTLPLSVLRQLGIPPGPDAPVLTLSTANGQRQAQVALVERVWLGDLEVGGVAVTTCEDCAAEDHVGLLGLNVSGGYNLTIDADRREVILARRRQHDRRLDIRPFSDLQARFRKYPGGRVDFSLGLSNLTDRDILEAVARIGCGDASWAVAIGPVPGGTLTEVERRLPRHEPCASYALELAEADW